LGGDWARASQFSGLDLLLIVDAVRGTKPPETLCWLAPEQLADRLGPVLSGHDVALAEVLAMARLLQRLPPTRILGVWTVATRQAGLELTPALCRALRSTVAALTDEMNYVGLAVRRKRSPNQRGE